MTPGPARAGHARMAARFVQLAKKQDIPSGPAGVPGA